MIIIKTKKSKYFHNRDQLKNILKYYCKISPSGNYENLRASLNFSSCFPDAFQVKLFPSNENIQNEYMTMNEMIDIGICDFRILFITTNKRVSTYLWCPLINIKAHYVQNEASKKVISFY
jgi:hypothetical protein